VTAASLVDHLWACQANASKDPHRRGVYWLVFCPPRSPNPALEIVNLDKLTHAGNRENLAEVANHRCYRFLKADVCDLDALRRICDHVNRGRWSTSRPNHKWTEVSFRRSPCSKPTCAAVFNLLETMRVQRWPFHSRFHRRGLRQFAAADGGR
jgi:hypothetical protein